MMNKKIISLVILVGLFFCAQAALGQAVITPPAGVPQDFSTILTNIVKTVGTVIASLGTIMIIIAGILYLTSAGSQERLTTAKKALIYAVVGIVIGLSATTIVSIVEGLGK